MEIREIEANLGKLFVNADPNSRTRVVKVIGREPEGRHSGERGWEVTYEHRDEDGKVVEKQEIVPTVTLLKLYQPYVPGEEDGKWGYDRPQGDQAQPETIPNTSLTPTIDTPGFALVTPLAMKVWMALFDHAQNVALFGADVKTDYTDEASAAHIDHARKAAMAQQETGRGIPGSRREGLEGQWAVPQLAKAVGKKERAIHYALEELSDLGWLRREKMRADGGEIQGFRYWILPPPKELTEVARSKKLGKAKENLHDAVQEVRRIKETK